MKRFVQYSLSIIFLVTLNIRSQEYDKESFLKDYAGDMIITTQVRGERNKAILRGTEAKNNREFVLKSRHIRIVSAEYQPNFGCWISADIVWSQKHCICKVLDCIS